MVTTDNSNYNAASRGTQFITQSQSDNTSTSLVTSKILDVTDIANVKVIFEASVNVSGVTTSCSGDWNETYATFIKLGDT